MTIGIGGDSLFPQGIYIQGIKEGTFSLLRGCSFQSRFWKYGQNDKDPLLHDGFLQFRIGKDTAAKGYDHSLEFAEFPYNILFHEAEN